MALIDELKKQSTSIEDNKKKVMEEIKGIFSKYLHSEKFEKYIKSFGDMQRRRIRIDVEYWQYVSGCSGTRFRVGGGEFYINEDDRYSYNTKYKGVDISKCQMEIGEMLYYLLKDTMRELGFTYEGTEDKMSWLNYYHKELTFSW